MTTEEITAKVVELKQALIDHKNFLDSIPDEVVDLLNDSCYYVNGAIESIESEIYDVERYLRGVDDEEEED